MMHLLWILIIGFVVGLLGRALHPGNDKMGIIVATVLGIVGAFLADFIGQALHIYRLDRGRNYRRHDRRQRAIGRVWRDPTHDEISLVEPPTITFSLS